MIYTSWSAKSISIFALQIEHLPDSWPFLFDVSCLSDHAHYILRIVIQTIRKPWFGFLHGINDLIKSNGYGHEQRNLANKPVGRGSKVLSSGIVVVVIVRFVELWDAEVPGNSAVVEVVIGLSVDNSVIFTNWTHTPLPPHTHTHSCCLVSGSK